MGRALARPPLAGAGLTVQVLKPEIRTRIDDAAVRCFAHRGYAGTSVADIAAAAGTAPANVYRYHRSKEALFDAVVPADLAIRHDALLDSRVEALADRSSPVAAAELLQFWLDNRWAMVVLLDAAEGTRVAGYPAAFVARLVAHAEAALGTATHTGRRDVLEIVFDNTRRAVASILRTARDEDHARDLVAAFWSYQVPGLDGLLAHLKSPLSAKR